MTRQPVPADALHKHYADAGGHADCYCAAVDLRSPSARQAQDERGAPVTLADFVTAFYTSPLFRIERWILRVAIGHSSTDAEAWALALGARDTFAAWTVEARTDDQLVMCDYRGRTRSWFMVRPEEPTLVWFGTAIAVGRGGRRIPFPFRALMGFHGLYSRALLRSAVRRMGG